MKVRLMTIRLKRSKPVIIATVLISWLAFLTLSGCQLTTSVPTPSASSTPLDKKYPAAVLVGTEANLTRGTVQNSSTPLPAEKPFYYSVRSFGGYGVKELTVELFRLEPEIVEIQQNPLVFTATLPIPAGKTNVLGTIPALPPGKYHLVIYRLDEDIAARQFLVE